MKRILAWLLCALLLAQALPVMAESAYELPLLRLTMTDENGREINLGSGLVVLTSSTVLTTVSAADWNAVKAYGPDGTAWRVTDVGDVGYGVKVLVLDHETGLTPAQFSRSGSVSRLTGITQNGLQYSAPVMSVAQNSYHGLDALLVSASEPLLPSAALTGESGELMGLVVAAWGEGEARYIAVTSEALLGLLLTGLGAGPQENLQVVSDTPWLRNVAMHYEGGILTLDWSQCAMDGLSDDSTFTVFFMDSANYYYTYVSVEKDRFTLDIYPVPGREYLIWVGHFHGDEDANDFLGTETRETFSVPEGSQFTDYHFTDESYLAWAPINDTPGVMEILPPLEPITAETLTDLTKSLYLQVINTYTVAVELEVPMLFTLHTPDDFMFSSVNGFVFGPEYMDNDIWSGDITDLFADYQQYGWGGFTPGEYEVRYTLGDQWGGGFTFTLE